MNKNSIFTVGAASLGALLIGLLLGRFLLPSGPQETASGQAVAETETTTASVWTCSMHPQIRQPEPGDCPICGMDLIPLADDQDDTGPRTMSMSESSRALAEIQTTVVVREFPEAKLRLVGKLEYDETRERSLSARFPARIEHLYVNYTGVSVKSGQHLAEVYSPELLTAQKELLTAYRSDPESSITLAAREKLRLWDLLPEQIDEIVERGVALDHFELKAPIGGVVASKNVKEGDYVQTGQSLFRIVDLSELWLHLDAFESDLAWLRYGQVVTFTVEAFPGESFEGTITFISPEINRKTRTVPVRVNVPNEDGLLKPGMFARGIVRARMAAGGKIFVPEFAGKWISPMHPEIVKDHPGQCDVCGMDLVPAEELGYVQDVQEEAPLVVPTSAVLRTGKRAVVYVQDTNAERPTYTGREIVLGSRVGDQFVIMDGLAEGELVVTHGAFKIDSALQIQAKPSMMNPDGGGPVPGHDHGATGSPGDGEHSGHAAASIIEISPELLMPLMRPYLDLQAALAADDFDSASKTLNEMMPITGHAGPLAELVHAMLASDSLQGIRAPHFQNLSNSLIEAIRAHPDTLQEDLYIMHCPMAMDGAGADWIQSKDGLLNPYYGAMMLRCGEIKETISAGQSSQNHHVH